MQFRWEQKIEKISPGAVGAEVVPAPKRSDVQIISQGLQMDQI
jgi:hypothetical protein